MNGKEYAEAKRRLEEIQRVLGSQLLTPEQQRDLELHAARLSRILQKRVVMGRVKAALIGAVVGAALAVLHNVFIAAPHTGHVPQTAAGWAAFYVGVCVPWALLGSLVGAVLGRLK